jgi:hypothetical protein
MTARKAREAGEARKTSGGAPPPVTVSEALERARRHARAAGVELAATARALLDAASLGVSGQPSDAHAPVAAIATAIDELAAHWADGSSAVPGPVVDAILGALDVEIARWEKQSTDDPDARAVLRTFLGVREILWEFGLRPSAEANSNTGAGARSTRRAGGGAARPSRKAHPKPEKPPRRVQRIEVQG